MNTDRRKPNERLRIMAYDKLIEIRKRLQENKFRPQASLIWLDENEKRKSHTLWKWLEYASRFGIDVYAPMPGKESIFQRWDRYHSPFFLLRARLGLHSYDDYQRAGDFIHEHKITGADVNAYIDLVCANIDLASELDALDPEKEKTSIRTTWRHRRALRKTGLHDGTVTKEKADLFFAQYGTSYEQLLRELNHPLECTSAVFQTLSRWRHADALLIFPLRGQLFNYYIARGMAEEMRRNDPTVNLRIRTMQTARFEYESNSTTWNAGTQFLKMQAERLLHTTPKEIIVMDLMDTGATQGYIKEAFAAHGRTISNFASVGERQVIHALGFAMSPNEILAKTATGQAIPHQNAAQLPKDTAWYTRYGTNSPEQCRSRLEFVREMLFIFGRIYFYLRTRDTMKAQ